MALYEVEIVTRVTAYVVAADERTAAKEADTILRTECVDLHQRNVHARRVKPLDHRLRGWDDDCLVYGAHNDDVTLGSVWPRMPVAGEEG